MSVSPSDEDPFAGDAGEEIPEAGTEGNYARGGLGAWERLWDSHAPGPDVEQLQADYGLEYKDAIGFRGVLRTAVGDGVPPIAEIALWVILTVALAYSSDKTTDSDEQSSEGGYVEQKPEHPATPTGPQEPGDDVYDRALDSDL